MTTNRRKKTTRYRGDTAHGWGSMKKRRGAGNRGGRGRAGTGKRGDAKKPSIWANKKYFGKHGFKKKGVMEKINPINIGDINEKIESMKNKGLAIEKAGSFELDLGKLGFNKLLGSGKITKKVIINVKYATDRAVEKVKKAGGNIIIPEKKEKQIKTPEVKESIKEKTEQKKDSKEE